MNDKQRIVVLETALRMARGHIILLGGDPEPYDDFGDQIQRSVIHMIDIALKTKDDS